MRLVSGSLSLDVMMVRREQKVAVTEAVRLCPSHGKLSPSPLIRNTEVCFLRIDIFEYWFFNYTNCDEDSANICQARALFVVMLSQDSRQASHPAIRRVADVISYSVLTQGSIKASGWRDTIRVVEEKEVTKVSMGSRLDSVVDWLIEKFLKSVTTCFRVLLSSKKSFLRFF